MHQREPYIPVRRLPKGQPFSTPVPPETRAKFGRGYVLGFLTLSSIALASLLVGGMSSNLVNRARWVAVTIASFGGTFAFGVLYQAAKGIDFSMCSLASNPEFGVMKRGRNPIGYWLSVLGILGNVMRHYWFCVLDVDAR